MTTVYVFITARAFDGEAELSTTMELERVPVAGDWVDTTLEAGELEGDDCGSFSRVTGVELSSRFAPSIYLEPKEDEKDPSWDSHDFDGGLIRAGLAEIIDIWFGGWEIDTRKTVWSSKDETWVDPEHQAWVERTFWKKPKGNQ